MHLSTHYYVVSLSRNRNALFEAFRDELIEVRNMGFPVTPLTRIDGPSDGAEQDERVLELATMVDSRFARYYLQEPLGLVLAGERDVRNAFSTVTGHAAAIVGHCDGDFSASNPRDLGKITWATVKEAMSGVASKALRDLDDPANEPGVVSGLDAVVRHIQAVEGATLMVEEDYHVHGHLDAAGESPEVVGGVDLRNPMDDVVDVVIEMVLGSGGSVLFLPADSLKRHDRIVLMTNEIEGVR